MVVVRVFFLSFICIFRGCFIGIRVLGVFFKGFVFSLYFFCSFWLVSGFCLVGIILRVLRVLRVLMLGAVRCFAWEEYGVVRGGWGGFCLGWGRFYRVGRVLGRRLGMIGGFGRRYFVYLLGRLFGRIRENIVF